MHAEGAGGLHALWASLRSAGAARAQRSGGPSTPPGTSGGLGPIESDRRALPWAVGAGPVSHALDDDAISRSSSCSDLSRCSASSAGSFHSVASSFEGGSEGAGRRATEEGGKDGGKQQHQPAQPIRVETRLVDRATAAVSLEAHYELPAHVLFELLADPAKHPLIFDAIEAADAELLEESGPRRTWRLDYKARWSFWKVSGVCENRMVLYTDREAGTVVFKLREPGFLQRYEGTWTIRPAGGRSLADGYGAEALPAVLPAAAAAAAVAPAGLLGAVGAWQAAVSAAAGAAAAAAAAAAGAAAALAAVPPAPSRAGVGGAPARAPAAGQPHRLLLPPVASVSAGSPIGELSGSVALLGRVQADLADCVTRLQLGLQQLPGVSAATAAAAAAPPAADAHEPVPGGAGGRAAGVARALGGALLLPGAAAARALCWVPLPGRRRRPAAAAPPADQPTDPEQLRLQRRLEAAAAAPWLAAGAPLARPSSAPSSAPAPPRAPAGTAVITVESLTSPKVTPPPPLNKLLKVQSRKQLSDMLDGLVRAAAAAAAAPPHQLRGRMAAALL